MKMFRTMLITLLTLCFVPLMAQSQPLTRLTLTGPAGEFVSGGQTYVYTPNDGTFRVNHDSNNGVTIQFSTPTRAWLWTVQFGGPHATSPAVGTYTDCFRYGYNNSQPGLAIWGDGRGCNELTGSFEVKHLVYSEFDVASLWVTFTQYCDGQSVPLTGEFIYNVDTATPTRAHSWGSLKTMYQ